MPNFNIISPTYSFVNFNPVSEVEQCCIGDNDVCLPVMQNNDIAFQFSITTGTAAKANDVYGTYIGNIQLILLDVNGSEVHNWTTANNLFFEKYRTGEKTVTYQWRKTLTDLVNNLVDFDKCFSFKVKATCTVAGTTETVAATSNCFIVKEANCYSSIIEYTNDEDYADFHYCNIANPLNRVRLWLYPSQPKPIEDKAIYRKSNGAIRQTRSLITKEYLILTEHLNEDIHDKITVALSHDSINIYSNNYSGGISKNGDYTIEWVDNICKAPANFKALATPYAIKNNSCADCSELGNYYECAVKLSAITNTIGLTIGWTILSGGSPYQYSITVNNGTPIIIGGGLPLYTFSSLPSGANIIEVKPICLIMGVTKYGEPKYITITI
jgi:hypothetical protein